VLTLPAPQRDIPKHKVQEIKPRGKGDGDNYSKDAIQKERTIAEKKNRKKVIEEFLLISVESFFFFTTVINFHLSGEFFKSLESIPNKSL